MAEGRTLMGRWCSRCGTAVEETVQGSDRKGYRRGDGTIVGGRGKRWHGYERNTMGALKKTRFFESNRVFSLI